MNTTRRNILLGFGSLVLSPSLAIAQARYPERNISFLVPYAAGGAFDLTIRALAKGMEPLLGQPVLVLNRPGAGGAIMLGALAKAKPDGYTIGSLNVNINSVAPHIQDMPFDPIADFSPIMTYGSFTTFVAVSKNSEFQTMKELVEFARKNPKVVTVGISSIGANSHLAMSRLVAQEKIEVTFVPFGGGAPASTALLGNHVTCAIVSGEILPHVRAGRLRLLALFNEARVAEFPNVPTVLDLGYGWAMNPWMGVGGPKGLPAEIVEKLQEALFKAMEADEFKNVMKDLAIITKRADATETAKLMRTSFDEHGAIVKTLKIGNYAPK